MEYGRPSGVVRGECRGGLGGAAAPNRPPRRPLRRRPKLIIKTALMPAGPKKSHPKGQALSLSIAAHALNSPPCSVSQRSATSPPRSVSQRSATSPPRSVSQRSATRPPHRRIPRRSAPSPRRSGVHPTQALLSPPIPYDTMFITAVKSLRRKESPCSSAGVMRKAPRYGLFLFM